MKEWNVCARACVNVERDIKEDQNTAERENVKDRERMGKSKYNTRQGQMVGWFRK